MIDIVWDNEVVTPQGFRCETESCSSNSLCSDITKAHAVLMQAKRQKVTKVVVPVGDDPIFSNPFFLTPEVAKAIGSLVTYIVYNHEKDPDVTMFPSDDDFRNMLYEHIDGDEELTTLLHGEDADEAYMEVSDLVHTQDVLCSEDEDMSTLLKREASHWKCT